MTNRDIVFTLKFKNQAGAVIRKFGTQLKGLGTKANRAGKSLKKLGDQFKRLADKAARAGQRVRNAGAMIREAGTQMTFAIGAPLAAAIGFTVKKFADLEMAMAGVEKTVGGSAEVIEGLKQEFIGMSNEMPTAATELARIGQVAGQLGIEAGSIDTFTETIAKMAAATDLSTEAAAFSLARVSNIMGTPQESAGKLASAMVDLGNNFAATEPEIATFALKLAGAGKVVGLTEGDVLGFSAALAAVGVKAQAGGTAISRAFIKIANEVAKGGAKVAEFAQITGVSTEEFARMFKEDAAGALQKFVLGLGKAQKAGTNVFKTLEDLGLSEIRTRDAMLRLSLSGDLLAKALGRGNKAFEEGTALNKEYAIFLDTTTSRLKILWNQISNAAAIMGEAFEPVITSVIGKLSEFAIKLQDWGRSLKGMNPEMKKTIALVAGFVIAAGPLLIIIGTLTQLFGFALLGVKAFGVQLVKTFAFFLTNPLGLFIIAIGAVIALLVKFRNELFTVGDSTARLQDYIVVAWEMIWEKIKFVGEEVVKLWNWVANTIAPSFSAPADQMASDLMTSFDVMKSIGNAIIQSFQLVGLSIGVYISAAFTFATESVQMFANAAKTSLDVITKILTGDFSGAWDAAMAPMEVNPFDNLAMHVEDGIADAKAILVSDPLGDSFAGLGERAGKRYKEHLAKGFKESPALNEAVSDIAKELENNPDIPKAGESFAKEFTKGFKTAMADYIESAADIAKQTEDAFSKAFQGMEDGLMEFIETGKFSFKDFAKSIISDFARLGVKSLLGDAMSMLSGGEKSEKGFASGLGDLVGGKGEDGEKGTGLMGMAGTAMGAIGSLFGIGGDKVEGATPGEQAIVDAIDRQNTESTSLFDGLGDKISTGWTGLKTAFSTGLDSLGSTMSGLFSSIGGLFGGGGGGGTTDTIGAVAGILGAFASEGGISQNLSKKGMFPASAFAGARRFAEGGVTSGTDKIPAMLSPNEAVIPLSRNRAVPIEGNVGGATTVNINVAANDVESFKQSQSQMLARFGTAVIKARRKTQ